MRICRVCCLFFLSALLAAGAASQELRIDKVEPPNWWSGMRWNRVQLMLYGSGLDDVTADFTAGPVVAAVHEIANSSYAFIDVLLPEELAPGTYELDVRKGSQRARVSFPVLAREAGGHQGFSARDVVYLITPDRFANGDTTNDRIFVDEFAPEDPRRRHGGDLRGIIDRLDYLHDLGITALWLNPVLENSGRNSYHGYAATDLYRIDPRLGTNEEYRKLVAEAHRHGLRVIFDHVSNHIGIRHRWIDDLPSPTWLNGTVSDHLRGRHYTLSVADPYADPNSEEMLRSFWFVDAMPDLNQRDSLLANYLIQNTLWWIEFAGIDGIREDTYPYPDQAFLARWAEAILEDHPQFNIVGEAWVNEPAHVAAFQKGSPVPRDFETNLPAVMDFPLSEALREYVAGRGRLRDVYAVFTQDFLYADASNLMTFVDNHDMARAIFIAGGDDRRVRQALAILLTARGIPQILYGTEINMMGGESHVELRADFPGGFPGDERSAFDESGRSPEEDAIFDFLRKLLHLRQQHPALTAGRMVHYPPTWNEDVYKYLRVNGDQTILVLVNGHEEERRVELNELAHWFEGPAEYLDLLSGTEGVLDWSEGVRVDAYGTRNFRIAGRSVLP